MWTISMSAVAAGFLLDLLIGDPHWLYHPVRLIGKWIEISEAFLRKRFPRTQQGERKAGFLMMLSTIAVTVAAVAALCAAAGLFGTVVSFLVQTILCYWLFAVRALRDESMAVCRKLEVHDLPGARYAVSMIVGRDTQNLTEEGVAKAAIETVAENAADGVIAPLFYMVIGGPVLGWAAKAVNTMDSMVGYKNDRYMNFGRYAAKLDDIVNFIPARLCALLMIAAAETVGLDRGNAWKIFKRDRYKHASPNSAQTESVMAGALNVALAGDAWYFGKLHKKQVIGDANRPVEFEDIRRANRLLYAVSVLALILLLVLRYLVTCI